MKPSKKLLVALKAWEGDVLTCYLDPVGIPTIGQGFTNASKILTDMVGKLVPGVTKITSEQSETILMHMLTKEYVPMVDMPGAKQNEFDVGISTVWNLGPKSQTWNWAKYWRAGDKVKGFEYLSSHYNKAGGRKLAGLVRRRKEEATIGLHGVYPQDKAGLYQLPSPMTVEAYNMLAKLGFTGKEAVLTYQKSHPHLQNDGIMGKATFSQLERDTLAAVEIPTNVVAVGGATAGAMYFLSEHWILIAACATVCALGYMVYKYHDVMQRRYNHNANKTIEV